MTGARARTARRGAYTLTEVVISCAILAIVLLGLTSATRIVGKAMPTTSEGAGSVAAAGAALNDFADELAVAKAFTTTAATDIRFTVPDRTGDAADDTIRYRWSGVVGAPLQRTINGGSAVDVVPNCRSFALTYDTAQVANPQTYTEGAETLVSSWTIINDLSSLDIDTNTWRSNYFVPAIPASAVSWSVTRVEFWARKNGGDSGNTTIELRPERNGLPDSRVLASTTYPESSLSSSYSLVNATFPLVYGLVPGQGMFIVWSSTSATMRVVIQQSATANSYVAGSNNSGASWSGAAQSVVYSIYGKVVTPDPLTYRTATTSVAYSIQSGKSSAATLSGRVRVYTQP